MLLLLNLSILILEQIEKEKQMLSSKLLLKEKYAISDEIYETLERANEICQEQFSNINLMVDYTQLKVLQAFQENNVSDFHLNGSTGYGYGDVGRDTLENVFASIFKTEKALVRAQIVSGTHAIAIALLGNLKNGEEMISATDTPYDTLLKVIGLHGERGSLIDGGVIYKEIPLLNNNTIDTEQLLNSISSRTKLIYFQRSKGYEWRPSFCVNDMANVMAIIKEKHPNIICMVDNCYGEFVECKEPTEVGADIAAGSLIKNPGGTIALSGGYLVGNEEIINNASVRLSAPGIGSEVGASFNFNRTAYQGLFMAPLIVGEALKGSVLAAKFYELLGFSVLPKYEEKRTDIIQAIQLGSKEKMLAFCRGLQMACPLDSHVKPVPSELPGYASEVIMAGGTFIQGSSIELSADGPIRPPYNIYLQGGLSMGHIKIGLLLSAQEVIHRGGQV